MDQSALIDTPPAPLPPAHRPLLARGALMAFCLYVAAIYVLALDQNLHWGLFPSASDKQIAAQIQELGNASLTKEKHDLLAQDLVNWNTFAVPPLLTAIEKGPPAIRDPAVKILQTIALKHYNTNISSYGADPVKLKQWWKDLQASWAKTEAEKKP